MVTRLLVGMGLLLLRGGRYYCRRQHKLECHRSGGCIPPSHLPTLLSPASATFAIAATTATATLAVAAATLAVAPAPPRMSRKHGVARVR